MKCIRIDSADENTQDILILVDKILYIDKDEEDDLSIIHLISGDIIYSKTSLKTIKERINSKGD